MGFYIYELITADDTLPRYVGVGKHGEPSSWLPCWNHRAALPGRLAAWFRTLRQKPIEKVLLGKATALSEKEARAIAKARIQQINRAATNEWAAFLMNERPINCGRRGRPCALLIGNQVEVFPSVTKAAVAEGVARETISRQVRQGRLPRRAKSGARRDI